MPYSIRPSTCQINGERVGTRSGGSRFARRPGLREEQWAVCRGSILVVRGHQTQLFRVALGARWLKDRSKRARVSQNRNQKPSGSGKPREGGRPIRADRGPRLAAQAESSGGGRCDSAIDAPGNEGDIYTASCKAGPCPGMDPTPAVISGRERRIG